MSITGLNGKRRVRITDDLDPDLKDVRFGDEEKDIQGTPSARRTCMHMRSAALGVSRTVTPHVFYGPRALEATRSGMMTCAPVVGYGLEEAVWQAPIPGLVEPFCFFGSLTLNEVC